MLKEISIEILRKCPNYCVHCSSLSDRFCQEILPYDIFSSVVGDAAELGTTQICISGGEPFLHPDIITMIDLTNSLGLVSYIYTSGVIFDSQGNRSSLDENTLRAVAGKVGKIIFNIGAGTSETYDSIMGTTGCFDLMKQSVATAVSLGICTEAHFVPMRLNIDQIEQAFQLCMGLGMKRVSFLRLVLQGRALDNAKKIGLSDAELQKLKHDLENLSKQFPSEVRIGVPLSINGTCHRCMAATGKLNIRYDGKVFPCEVFKDGRADQSLEGPEPESIYEYSLQNIFQHSAYLQRVRALSDEFSRYDGHEMCIGQHLINRNRPQL